MDNKDDSGFDSDHKSGSSSPFASKPEKSDESPDVSASNLKTVRKTSELQRKIEKQREKNRRKQIVDEQPRRTFLISRNRLNIPNKSTSMPVSQDQQPLVAIMSDDSEEDEFAVPSLSKEAQREIADQLKKDGYDLDLEPDDEDLDLIPPRPLHERCACCPSVTWVPQKCAIQ